MISEHWYVNNDIECIGISNFKLLSHFSRSHHIRGGTSIFVKQEILQECAPVNFIKLLSIETVIECCAVSFKNIYCLINVYRPPSDSSNDVDLFFSQFSKLLSLSQKKFKHIIICGDFNIDQFSNSLNSKRLFDILSSFEMTSLINEYTRIFSTKNYTSYSSIDYVVTNIMENIDTSNFDTGLSDHHCQVINFDIADTMKVSNVQKTLSYRNINANSLNVFLHLLSSSKFDICINSDVNLVFNRFLDEFLWCFNAAFEKRTKVIDYSSNVKQKIQFSSKLNEKRKQLNNLDWLRKRVFNEQLNENYKKLKKEVNAEIFNEKRIYFGNKIIKSSNKNKTVWSIVNQVKGKQKNRNISEILYKDKVLTDPSEQVSAFGEFLTSSIHHKINDYFKGQPTANCTVGNHAAQSMFFTPVTEVEIIEVIQKLPNKKSTGYDEIPITIIKESKEIIAPILTHIVNMSVAQGEFPTNLKLGILIPLFKKGDHKIIENYRPIALLSVLSKIIEKAVAIRVEHYLNSFQLISNCQHGFRAGYSTETSTIEYTQDINNRLDAGCFVVSLLFDLTRAFDTIEHSFISEKLQSLGIRGCINQWFLSFLSNRKMRVKIEDVISEEHDIDIGTPQGSVLGPLIFLLFINDVPNYISKAKVLMYADDTCMVISDNTKDGLLEKINTTFKEFETWCNKNRLMINFSKTAIIEYHNQRKVPFNFSFTFNNITFEGSKSVKFLGTNFDCNMSWDTHVNSVCHKMNQCFYLLTVLKSMLDRDTLLQVYYSYAYSAMAYNIVVWGQAQQIQRVFILQKRIIRLIFDLPFQTSCRETFSKNKILTTTSIYLLKLLNYMFVHQTKFIKNSAFHSYDTRYKDNLSVIKVAHTFCQKSPNNAGIKYFNKLPNDIKNSKSQAIFVGRLKKMLADNCFYTLNEFENYLFNINSL